VFALSYTVDRSSGLFTSADELTIDTVQVADEFRTAPVDVAGGLARAQTAETANVILAFEQDRAPTSAVSDGYDALTAHTDGGSYDRDGTIIGGYTPDEGRSPERFEDLTIRWQ